MLTQYRHASSLAGEVQQRQQLVLASDAQLGDDDKVSRPGEKDPAQLPGCPDESFLIWGRGLVNRSLWRDGGNRHSARRNCLLIGHRCPLSVSSRLGADMNSPPQENGFQLKSMGCTQTGEQEMSPCTSEADSPEGSLLRCDPATKLGSLEDVLVLQQEALSSPVQLASEDVQAVVGLLAKNHTCKVSDKKNAASPSKAASVSSEGRVVSSSCVAPSACRNLRGTIEGFTHSHFIRASLEGRFEREILGE
ncbi:hypothetical protein EYF80_014782 [Liparis tanakae]|uniref:Uncharacterized protein n=1 Tax=Liparis tanakae TaxID=230148 RepID=A0A4Z2IAI1_9TELE|nr:hypothetical protein EYF80_014782 [Liparis tanakae]